MYNYKVFACICLLLIIVILTTPFVSEFLRLNLNITLSEEAGLVLKLSPLIFIIPQSLMVIHYFNSFSKLENQAAALIENNNNVREDKEEKEDINKDENFYENEKYKVLYQEIIEYFEKSKPYKNFDFNIQSLAKALQTNTSYISRAINIKNEKGFKGLLNYYRIEQVKKDFLNNHQKKYTIKHIYTDAGFSHQASFNRTFKELEGMTPNEFIKNIKRKNKL
ncbi:helix-turn-helix domain-containing protein [Chryseobacterium soli]|nr:helix-turn-helix domain-containing protein [Chryseobacterium soli]